MLIKPDGLEKKVVGKIIDRLEQEQLKLAALKVMNPSRAWLDEFYSVHRGKPFFESFIEFMMSGPSVAMVWKGEDAISRVRSIMGATDSRLAEKGTLRNLYGTDNRRNLVHGSDSQESAEREIKVIFGNEKI